MPDTQETAQGNVQNTQEKTTAYERTKELTDRLEAGMTDLFQSDKYKDYLKSMSCFHSYSSRNIMLINMQMPGATRVASFKLWEEKFNRHVKKGEHGIRIFAPIGNKPEKKLMEKLDPETGAPLIDANGKVIMEEMTALTNGPRFKLVPVFDASQTYGDPLPELVENLTGNVAHYEAFMDALKAVSTLPIEFEPLRDGHDGYCRYGEKIGIREGMSEAQTVAAIVHEIAHLRLHDKGLENADVPKFVKEVQAESVAYVFCQHYSVETAPNSFGYLAEWGSRDMKEFKASLDTIRKESSGLINAVDGHFKQICQERGIDLTKAPDEQGQRDSAVFAEGENAERIGDYGEQRVSVVLANTVRLQDWDGRYSGETKAWAKDTEIPQVRDNRDYFSAAHPAVLDGYIRLARKEMEKKPSILDAIKQGAEKSRGQSEPKPEAKKSKEMEM